MLFIQHNFLIVKKFQLKGYKWGLFDTTKGLMVAVEILDSGKCKNKPPNFFSEDLIQNRKVLIKIIPG